MSLKLIAVDGCTITPQGIVTIGGGTLSITSIPSVKVKAENKGVYKTPLIFVVAGANATGYDPGTVVSVAPISIIATSTKNLAENLLVMRVDDQILTAAMTGTISGVPTPFVEPFKITVAGQTKILGE